ncbi:MAG: bifunctional homocysteine S-methyltransferase/methylenetetrahydrofolate reductase [Acidobacteria bacterium]|nr:bifunctional homocysteine S-methyltransferase/methylenetetrahydrofolate reductase [Acidobacteriota bacterium]
MKRKLIDLLDQEILLADGAMGTLLVSRGVDPNALADQNLVNPDLVRAIHREYIRAGARLVETNTFLANRMKLKEYGVEDKLEAINRAGVRLAREAVQRTGKDVFIAGSVGPLGALVKPYGNLTLADLAKAYVEQMTILVEEGVDLLIIETHPSLLEALEAVRAARTISATLPLIAQMTFLEDGKSKFGDDLRRSLEALAAADVDVVGVNCSGPQTTFDIMENFLRQTDLRVSVMTNAGLPQLIGGRQIYLSSPEYLQVYARRFAEAGANIIGGCCGTTPEHIRVMGEVIAGQAPRRIRERARVPVVVPEPILAPEPGIPAPLATKFQQKLGQQLVVTVELAPPRGVDCTEVIERSRKLAELGVDAISVSENTGARVRMSCLALAHLIQSHTGVETILHFTCHDRNLSLIQSELLGAAALGIRNILALTGEPSTAGEVPHVTSVFDVNATGLVGILHGFNHGHTVAGQNIGQPTGFRIGVTVNLAAEDLDAEAAQFEERIEAGAHFAQTQPVYDIAIFERFLQRMGSFPVPVLISIMPLTSGRHAEFLHHEIPGIIIPEALRRRMHEAQDPKQEGLQIAKALIRQLRDQVAGIHLMAQADHGNVVSEIMSICAASASSSSQS